MLDACFLIILIASLFKEARNARAREMLRSEVNGSSSSTNYVSAPAQPSKKVSKVAGSNLTYDVIIFNEASTAPLNIYL